MFDSVGLCVWRILLEIICKMEISTCGNTMSKWCWPFAALRGNAARKRYRRLLKEAARQKQEVAMLIVKVPQNLAAPFRQLQKMCAADAQRPKGEKSNCEGRLKIE